VGEIRAIGRSGNRVMTIPLAVSNFAGAYAMQWDLMLTAILMAMTPIVIFFLFAQDSTSGPGSRIVPNTSSFAAGHQFREAAQYRRRARAFAKTRSLLSLRGRTHAKGSSGD
jgi:hypothetical protein